MGNFRINGFVTSVYNGAPSSAILDNYFPGPLSSGHNLDDHDDDGHVDSSFDKEPIELDDVKYFQVKDELQAEFEHKTNINSIIGALNLFPADARCVFWRLRCDFSRRCLGLSRESSSSRNLPQQVKPKKASVRRTHHETLQRIEPSYDLFNHYQQHWFSVGLEVSRSIHEQCFFFSSKRTFGLTFNETSLRRREKDTKS